MNLKHIVSLFGFLVVSVSANPVILSNDTGFNLTHIFNTLGLNSETQDLIMTLTSQFSGKINDILDEKRKTSHLEDQLLRAEDDVVEDSRWWDDGDE